MTATYQEPVAHGVPGSESRPRSARPDVLVLVLGLGLSLLRRAAAFGPAGDLDTGNRVAVGLQGGGEAMAQRMVALLLGISLLCACGGDEAGNGGPAVPACKDTMCEPGAVKCIGNKTAACAADGMKYALNDCGLGLCVNGKCEDRECTFPGFGKCAGDKQANLCTAAGKLTQQPCGEGEQCAAGACRKLPCNPTETSCGWRAFATCEQGAKWVETACAAAEICIAGACAAQVCAPGKVECNGDGTASRACRSDGSGFDEASCGEGLQCVGWYGTCEAKLCTGDAPDPDAGPVVDDVGAPEDAVAEEMPPKPDLGPAPELEPLDVAECVVDGKKIVFTSNKSATYVETDKDLRIAMDKGLDKIEISIKPIEEFDFGVFKSTEASEISVLILYNDGSEIGRRVQWKYQSVEYEVDLEKFQTKGGRVKGTFSGQLTADGGATTIPVTNGVFDVKRHD